MGCILSRYRSRRRKTKCLNNFVSETSGREENHVIPVSSRNRHEKSDTTTQRITGHLSSSETTFVSRKNYLPEGTPVPAEQGCPIDLFIASTTSDQSFLTKNANIPVLETIVPVESCETSYGSRTSHSGHDNVQIDPPSAGQDPCGQSPGGLCESGGLEFPDKRHITLIHSNTARSFIANVSSDTPSRKIRPKAAKGARKPPPEIYSVGRAEEDVESKTELCFGNMHVPVENSSSTNNKFRPKAAKGVRKPPILSYLSETDTAESQPTPIGELSSKRTPGHTNRPKAAKGERTPHQSRHFEEMDFSLPGMVPSTCVTMQFSVPEVCRPHLTVKAKKTDQEKKLDAWIERLKQKNNGMR